MFTMQAHISAQLEEIRRAGLYKNERVITTPQNPRIRVRTGEEVLNLCANNYLGLSDNPEIVAAAREALDKWGFGLSSVRFICGTQSIHKELEARISEDTRNCQSDARHPAGKEGVGATENRIGFVDLSQQASPR